MADINQLAEVISLDNGRYQGDCGACGWYTRECNSKQWTEDVVTFHHSTCPAKLSDAAEVPFQAVVDGVNAFHAYSRRSGYKPYPISDGQVRAILAALSSTSLRSSAEES